MPVSCLEAGVSTKPPPIGLGHIQAWARSEEDAGPSARDGLSEPGLPPGLWVREDLGTHNPSAVSWRRPIPAKGSGHSTSILKSFPAEELSSHSQAQSFG